MKKWPAILAFTVLFWAVWVGIAGLAAWIHGDCGIGSTDSEIAACVREKRWVGLAAMAVGVLVYAVTLWRLLARPAGRPGPRP